MRILIFLILIIFISGYLYQYEKEQETQKVLKSYSVNDIDKEEIDKGKSLNILEVSSNDSDTGTLDKDMISASGTMLIDINTGSNNQKKDLDYDSLSLYRGYYSYLDKIDDDIKNSFIFRGNTEEKELAITFDDGPLSNTKDIINYLNKNKVKATFFVLCSSLNKNNINYYTGSYINLGIHSYNHTNFQNSTKDYIKDDIKKCKNILSSYNLETKYFRPPYGIITENMLASLNDETLNGVIWSIDSLDWNGYKEERLYNQVIFNLSSGDIVLFHDMISVSDLEKIVNGIKISGYKIVSLTELLN